MPYTLAYKNRFYTLAETMPSSLATVPHEGTFQFRQLSDGINEILFKLTGEEMKWLFDSATQGAMLLYPDKAQTVLEILLRAIDYPPDFPTEAGDCPNFLPSASFLSYAPQNPYNQPDFVPDGYLLPPFFVNSELVYPEFYGYQATDMFIQPAAINIDPIDLLTANFPTVVISVIGSGQLEVDFLAVQSGSSVIVKVGSPPNILEILGDGIIETGVTVIDLFSDPVGVPIESDNVVSEEINIEATTGERTDIYLVFVPNLDDSLLPLRFGGGIRQIGLCGFETGGDMGIEDIRISDGCTLQYRILGEWVDASGWENINDCIVPTTLSSESVEAVLPETTTIVEITNNVTNVTNEVTVLQNNQTSQNIVPPIADITGDDICNAAEYIADKLIETAKQVWTDSGDLTIAEFLVAMLELRNGYVGDFLTAMYNAAIPAYTNTPLELDDARDYLAQILYCNELDKAGASADITASGDITSHAKDLLIASLDAVTDAKYSLWAFVGKETVVGSCSCDPILTKVFNFALGSQLGWVENVLSGQTRALWDGNGWSAKNLSGYYGLVIEKSFTWPTDFVITQTRVWINDTNHAIPYQYVYGLPYANGTFNLAGPDSNKVLLSTAAINKGTRTGIGIEFSKTLNTGQKITRIEFDYTGTPPAW